MDNKKNGIPKLRFPGFTGAWEQRKLGEVADIFDGTHQTPKYTDSGIKFVSVENIATLETEKYISQKAYESEYSNKQAEKGDVLMTRIGNIGTPKLIEKDEPLAYYVTLALLKPKNIDSNFLVWGISSPKVQRNIWKLTLHIAFPKKINLGEINQVSISIPSINEQKKIGDFFKQLDSLIALHQRKLEHLQEQKKGLLQKMFPKNGETVPEVRFPGFTDAWEQRKLGEIGKVFTGNTPSTKNTENWTTDKSIGHVWITPTDINNNIMFDSERYLSDKGWSQARVVPKNSVLITSIASIGKNAINGVEVAFNQQINALVVQKNNPYFILTLMNKEKQRFESLAGQTATPIINKSTFSSFMVKIPSETEQEQIGEFFKQLDSLIALHQRKLDHLELMKKGLLQQMFV
ncbi:restriction endonuclease subunit S [Ligilactobacillus salivarius]|uniref:restriction endonuclease subunit S n=1 Tax=Ligilactobacillus salivarius TaxID=1624 RepID=UPI001D3C350B|nr:restriction endonuclease subunit S [Ligilactobacillus salivarius]MBZ4030418.1 restriction endonuclease subunit S [Ligilactobacillus salivarius]